MSKAEVEKMLDVGKVASTSSAVGIEMEILTCIFRHSNPSENLSLTSKTFNAVGHLYHSGKSYANLAVQHPTIRDAYCMSSINYKQWIITILPDPCEDAWAFYVCSPEGDVLSNHQLFASTELALQAAQKHIDNHMLLNEVVSILDPLFESRAITPEDYFRCIEIFKTLAADSASDETL